MDKKLRDYITYIKKEAKHPSAELIDYHRTMTQQFQHERFIHLIVTMFFALFLILFFGGFVIASLALPAGPSATILEACIGLVTLILLITTLFYIRHYYQLENGTQELEEITRKLYKRD